MKRPVPEVTRPIDTPIVWDHVDPPSDARERDMLGLTSKDRQALGLSAPKPDDLVAARGDAHAALVDVLARGAPASRSITPTRSDKPRVKR